MNKLRSAAPKVITGNYPKFISEFLSEEKSATRQGAVDAWNQMKGLDMPKTYPAWKEVFGRRRRG